MNAFVEKDIDSTCSSETIDASVVGSPSLECNRSELGSGCTSELNKSSLLSSFFSSAFSTFRTNTDPLSQNKKNRSRTNGWVLTVKKIVLSGSMQRIQDRVLGTCRTGISSQSDIWILGVCYKISKDGTSQDHHVNNGLTAFMEDFSSRILITYRKGFDPIGNTKFTTDASWGCMLRSSQMLVAQALLFHSFGRSWRKNYPQLDPKYLEIIHDFGDSEASSFSIHNLLEAGKPYGLIPGSWIGPYAMCCSWKSLALLKRNACQSLPIAVYVVSGDANGERGGAPAVCIEDASRHCCDFSEGKAEWAPLLILIPLVLGLETVNPRYVPSLQATFTFPQSLGILGGRPGTSTYIIGIQDSNAFYLDPHHCQQSVSINPDDLEADTSSYHCDLVRHIPLDSIDSSLAIGFYCRDRDDFDDFCSRSSKLVECSNGAPLFTVAKARVDSKPTTIEDGAQVQDEFLCDMSVREGENCFLEDEWQLL